VFQICDEERQQKIAARTLTDMQRSIKLVLLNTTARWRPRVVSG